MLRWERRYPGSKDIRIVNPEAFDSVEYKRRLDRFKADAFQLGQALRENLEAFGRNPRGGWLRATTEGYIGLNRWCITRGSQYQSGVDGARSLWKYLFGEHIPELASARASRINKAAWATWYARISEVSERDQDSQEHSTTQHAEVPSAEKILDEEHPEESYVQPSSSVSVERDLRDYLADNPSEIGQGFKTIAREYQTGVGYIDLLCEDGEGNLVVIETKKGRESDAVVGQVLRYMGWLRECEERDVRGIIIARGSDRKLKYAVAALGDVQLLYYRLKFEISGQDPEDL